MGVLDRILIQIPGWHSNRKLVVIESDDWGCKRIHDKHSLERLSKVLPAILNDPYTKLDALETSQDLEALFEVLNSVRDKNERPAMLTANTIVANPDFNKIKECNFSRYVYRPFTDDLTDDPQRQDLMNWIREGISSHCYKPQLHGREHLNISQWMAALRNGHKELLLAFENKSFGIPLREKVNFRNNVMAAYDFKELKEIECQGNVIQDGQNLFYSIFGFKSETFVPPSYVWSTRLELVLEEVGIRGIQGVAFQYVPNPGGVWYKKSFRYTGKKSSTNIRHLVRNVFFEPAILSHKDIVGECLRRVSLAFRMKKPAIISSHRLNFMGSLVEENRSVNLHLFKKLLQAIVRKWPDIEFKSSDELLSIMMNREKT